MQLMRDSELFMLLMLPTLAVCSSGCLQYEGNTASVSYVGTTVDFVSGSLVAGRTWHLKIDSSPTVLGEFQQFPSLDSALDTKTSPAQTDSSSSFMAVTFRLQESGLGRQRCHCSLTNNGLLANCTDYIEPQPPWPTFDSCQWRLTLGNQLMESDRLNWNHSCLDPTSMTVDNLSQFSPAAVTFSADFGTPGVLFRKYTYSMVQHFNGSKYIAFLSDAVVNYLWPVRIGIVNESVTVTEGRVLIYRMYFGWSRYCLHICRAVYKTASSYLTVEQTCQDLDSQPEPATDDGSANCTWTYTVDCTPVLVSLFNRSQPCERTAIKSTQTMIGTTAQAAAGKSSTPQSTTQETRVTATKPVTEASSLIYNATAQTPRQHETQRLLGGSQSVRVTVYVTAVSLVVWLLVKFS